MSDVIELLKTLIAINSITPDDNGCQKIIIEHMKPFDFQVESFSKNETVNHWIYHGTGGPVFVFCGHTDVVPPGPEDQWTTPPFIPTIKDGVLYGRGAADMKSGLAASVIALENFVKNNPNHPGTVGLLVTSDEEGRSIDGIRYVMEVFKKQKRTINYAVVGEASAQKKLGDTIKVGRRGILTGHLKLKGKQGHIAYPNIAVNPIHHAHRIFHELIHKEWDNGNDDFQPTQFQISNINAGTGASNVIPGEIEINFNFRFSPEVTADYLMKETEAVIAKEKIPYEIDWLPGGDPFYSTDKGFITHCSEAIHSELGFQPEHSTIGGTSDGRFIAKLGAEVIECGPINESIHQIDEHVIVEDVERLVPIYEKMVYLK